MSQETFAKELAMCKELHKKNNGKCNWGECETCGVIPLLHKLGTGELVETPEDVQNLKRSIFGSERIDS